MVFLNIYAVDKIFTRPPVPAVPPNINSVVVLIRGGRQFRIDYASVSVVIGLSV